MNPQYEFEDIEDYLANRMSELDRKAFEQALDSDPELALRVEALKAEPKANRLLREAFLVDQFNQWDQETAEKKIVDPYPPPGEGAKMTPIYRKWWLPLAAAASLAGIAILGITFGWIGTTPTPPITDTEQIISADSSEQPQFPVNTKRIVTPSVPIVAEKPVSTFPSMAPELIAALDETFIEEDFNQPLMGGNQEFEVDELYKAAAKLYDKGDYKAALKLLEKPGKAKDAEYFYLRAYTYYHLGEYRKAEQGFHAIRNFDDSNRRVDATWGEVFCMAKQFPASRERLDAALQEIIDKNGHYAKRALKLQDVLKKH